MALPRCSSQNPSHLWFTAFILQYTNKSCSVHRQDLCRIKVFFFFFCPSIATKFKDLDRLFPTPCDGLLFVLPASSVFPQWCLFQPVRSTWNYPNDFSLCLKVNRDSLMWHTKFYKVRTLLFSPLTLALFTPLGNPLL